MSRTRTRIRRGRRVLRRLRPHHVPRAGRVAVRRWQDYRERQLALLAESNRLQQELRDQVVAPVTIVQGSAAPEIADRSTPGAAADQDPRAGRSWSLASPFYVGFTFALGALLAWVLVQNLTRLTSVFTFLAVALFVTLALDPVVQWLTRRGFTRGPAVFVVFLGLVAVVTVVGLLVVPPIVTQAGALVEKFPTYLQNLGSQPWLAELDARYDLSGRLTDEADRLATDGRTISTVFGGVLGAAGWVAGSLVGILTSVILTLYLLATLPTVKDAAYLLVPSTRRPRVVGLAEEIMRRVGGYALGQSAVATINAVCSWIMMQIMGIPYPAVLAVLVGLLGLIPMIGATLGAIIVGLVALTV